MARTKNEELHKKRKKQILAAAKKCFVEKGIHQASMQDICKTGKISPGALYRYFPSKQSIIEALAALEHAENLELIEYVANANDPVKALIDAVPDLTKFLLDHEHARFLIEMSSEATRNSDVFRAFDEVDSQLKNELVRVFKQAKKEGRIQTSTNLQSAVTTLFALFDGIVGLAATENPPKKAPLDKDLKRVIKALFAE